MYTNGKEFLVKQIPKSEVNSPLMISELKINTNGLIITYSSQNQHNFKVTKHFRRSLKGGYEYFSEVSPSSFSENTAGCYMETEGRIKEIRLTIQNNGPEGVQLMNFENYIEIQLPEFLECRELYDWKSEIFQQGRILFAGRLVI